MPGMTYREELAWAAGFFDGEGYAGILSSTRSNSQREYTRSVLRMQVTQAGPYGRELLERFKSAVGGFGVIRNSQPPGNRQSRWDWHCQGVVGCQRVYAALWQFLGPRKREQIFEAAKTAIAFEQRPTMSFGGRHQSPRYIPGADDL